LRHFPLLVDWLKSLIWFCLNMTEKEKKIVPAVILNDLKYLSVRKLYFDWFFNSASEVAVQLLDNSIKLYLQSIDREDLITHIRQWRGDETHNIVRIIDTLVEKLRIDFPIEQHRDVLESIYKLYRVRYLDSLEKIGESRTLLKDLDTIDYTYKYFRDILSLSAGARAETLMDKLFFRKEDLLWGEDKMSLYQLFYRDNKHFRPRVG